ncbi:hypothetical protein ACH40F_29200 [Streptomyces sp. NPDC020794]|uniref:hypothetical protein n=1 Tax=unclassified Streptomyces TaxID=2593676 RepID=UPI0036E0CAEE
MTSHPYSPEAMWDAVMARRDPAAAKRHAARRAALAAAARPTAEAREAHLRSVIGNAVGEALRKQLPGAVAQFTETAHAEPLTESAPAVLEKALHEMTTEEWDTHRQAYWGDRLPNHSRPITIGDLVTGQHAGHEA